MAPPTKHTAPPSQDHAVPATNPFAPPAVTLPAAITSAWRKYAVVTVALFIAMLGCDLFYALTGVPWFAIISISSRLVLPMIGTVYAAQGVLQFAGGWRNSAREGFATGLIFWGVAIASVPPLLLLDWIFDMK